MTPRFPNLEGTDIFLCNLQSQCDFNGLGARCVKYYPTKKRYVVRIHHTGRTLLVKPCCVTQQLSTEVDPEHTKRLLPKNYIQISCNAPGSIEESKRAYIIKDDEKFTATTSYIRKNVEMRRQLSLRVKEGYLTKGPGCLIANFCDTKSAVPRALDTAEEILQPHQTIWMSNKELKQQFGEAWSRGCGELYYEESFHKVFGKIVEWPELMKQSALSARVINFERWDDGTADPEQFSHEKDFYNNWGMDMDKALECFGPHVMRRCAEGLPMKPSSKFERALISHFHHSDSRVYDSLCRFFSKTLEPIGEQDIWDDTPFNIERYKEACGFYILSFNSIPFSIEKLTSMDNVIEGTGWQCNGFESLTFWSPSMDEQLRGKSGEEAWRMFEREGTAPDETAVMYDGGSFRTNLPSSTVQTTYVCGNPHCKELEHKVKTPAQGKKEWHGTELSLCSRCRKIKYCSKKCQLSDWKRHKPTCRS